MLNCNYVSKRNSRQSERYITDSSRNQAPKTRALRCVAWMARYFVPRLLWPSNRAIYSGFNMAPREINRVPDLALIDETWMPYVMHAQVEGDPANREHDFTRERKLLSITWVNWSQNRRMTSSCIIGSFCFSIIWSKKISLRKDKIFNYVVNIFNVVIQFFFEKIRNRKTDFTYIRCINLDILLAIDEVVCRVIQ